MMYIIRTRDRGVVLVREDFEEVVELIHHLNTEANELGHAWVEVRG